MSVIKPETKPTVKMMAASSEAGFPNISSALSIFLLGTIIACAGLSFCRESPTIAGGLVYYI
jgi:hypothetical protein